MPIMVVGRKQMLLVAVVAVVTFGVHGALSYQQWITGYVPSWDLGIFSQLAKAYSLGQAPIVPIKGEGFNLLGDHFHPILVLLGPLWAIWPSPLMLLLTQGALFALSTIPITRYAISSLGSRFGTVLGLAYGLSWGLQSATAAQFHEIAFTVPLLAFGVIAYLEGRLVPAACWIGATVFTKEDMGLTVAAFGVLLWFQHRDRRRLAGIVSVWGVFWTVAAMALILPALNPHQSYDYVDRIGHFGASLHSLDTYVMLAMLAAATGLIGLRSPVALLMVPTLGWRLIGNVPFYWGWQWHYSASIMPVAFAALLDQLPRLHTRRSAERPGPTWQARWALCLAIASTVALGPAQPATWLADGRYWNRWRVPGITAALQHIPAGTTVLSDLALLAYLVPDHEVYWIGSSHPRPDVVVRDIRSVVWPQDAQTDLASWAAKAFGGKYATTLNQDGFIVVTSR